jgi:hypothetical protein
MPKFATPLKQDDLFVRGSGADELSTAISRSRENGSYPSWSIFR